MTMRTWTIGTSWRMRPRLKTSTNVMPPISYAESKWRCHAAATMDAPTVRRTLRTNSEPVPGQGQQYENRGAETDIGVHCAESDTHGPKQTHQGETGLHQQTGKKTQRRR